MGLKNAATASARFGQIKKRLGWSNGTASGSGGNATSRATTKSGSGTNVSPSKVTKSRGRPAAKSPRGKKGAPASLVKDELDNEHEEVKIEEEHDEPENGEDEKDDMHDFDATEG